VVNLRAVRPGIDPPDQFLTVLTMGRSRGGLTTEIHAVTDARGLPITLKLTAGQAHDGRPADGMLGTVESEQTLLADAAYDGNRLCDHLARVGAKAAIEPIPGRSAPPPLDQDAYRRRNRIERFFSKLKHYRAIATRYERGDATFSPSSNSPHHASGCAFMSR
jgi:transposase